MKVFKLERTQYLPISLKESWSFFSNPSNLKDITPPELDFRITSDVPNKMFQGEIITYTISPFPNIRLRWVTEIKHVNEPFQFVDEQRFGPYKFWHHLHTFEEVKGGIKMKDIVHYGLSFGFLSSFVDKIIVRDRLERIFNFRYSYLEKKFGQLSINCQEFL